MWFFNFKIVWLLAVVITLVGAGEICHSNDLKGLEGFQVGIRSDRDMDRSWLLQLGRPIDLSSFIDLTGEIPPTIGSRLPRLRKLALSGNQFKGTLPESIGKLSELQELYLSENSFTGSIPGSIGNLQGLRMLDLHSNRLSGSIPGSMGELQCLKELDLSNNSLSGRIPSSITRLKAVSVICLDNNHLERSHTPSGSCRPFGLIPSSIGNLRSLTELYLNSNRLSGQLPASISQLANLLIFSVSYNLIEGPLPHQRTALANLQTLELSFNQLNLNYILKWLLKLPSLSRIFLAGCNIQGGLSEDVLTTPSPLQKLDLSVNRLTGSIPGWIGKLTELYSLNLSLNDLVDTIPTSIMDLTSLGLLDLHSNKLAVSLEWRYRVRSLTFLDLSDNSFTGGIEQIGMETQLDIQYINLSHNMIKGRLPDSIGRLESLKSLDLSYNRLDSEIPATLGNASSMENLKPQRNHFTGRIPDEFLKFKNLKDLDLSSNSLEGRIPYGEPLIGFPRGSYLGNKDLCGAPLEPCQP
ncbi:receptor-like protein kinase [Salvia splendens]|uniref:receptor-like protein kinase n=1 Tax=Salvia splendens TaxID=180675 RepID=UPI001C2608AC|nr:receptor-like protein kinase [Salvia splendens]